MLKSCLAVVLLLSISAVTNALHFYLDAGQRRCFIEELPANTVAEGICYMSFSTLPLTQLCIGNYRGLEWSQGERIYKVNPELGIVVEVEVCPDPNQSVH